MALSIQGEGPNQQPIILKATAEGKLLVETGEAAKPDRELLVQIYACKQAWAGTEVGNVIRNTQTRDVSGAISITVSTQWENLSTGLDIDAPPNVPEYTVALTQGDALTLAQLLSAGLATAINQNIQTGYLDDIALATQNAAQMLSDKRKNEAYAFYLVQQVDEATPGTTYVRKQGADAGDTWLIQRIVESGTDTTITFAGVRNNSAVTTATAAWTARASLTYGEISAA